MSRKASKSARRERCSLKDCRHEPFKKIEGYYYRGKYYCSKTHGRKSKKTDE